MPVSAPTGTDVAQYLGDTSVITDASAVLLTVVEYVRSYTRGAGFWEDDGGVTPLTRIAPDLRAVCVTAAARELNVRDKLGMQREEIAGYSSYLGPSADSFSLRERRVLDDWRRKAC